MKDMEAGIVNKSGQLPVAELPVAELTDIQLYGGEVPLVCTGYLPDDLRRGLQLRDAGVTLCPTHNVPCPALNVHSGECEALGCVVETRQEADSV